MAQQLINYGTYPDDANADAIRTAFLKVEQNFTDLYNNGVAGVSSVNSGQGVIARRSGSNVFVSANVYQLQVASAANSLVFSLGTTNANVAVYSQGSDVLNINPAEIQKKLEEIGAEKIGEFFQRWVSLDYPDWRLDKKGAWIRVRDEGDGK